MSRLRKFFFVSSCLLIYLSLSGIDGYVRRIDSGMSIWVRVGKVNYRRSIKLRFSSELIILIIQRNDNLGPLGLTVYEICEV